MAAKRVKMLEGINKEEYECGDMDRISKLPDFVIHHILSFLPTIDVVRMSLLSKRWRHMWYLVPTTNLRDEHFQGDRKECFKKFVDKYLKWRKIGTRYIVDSFMTRFTLEMSYHGGKNRVDKWLNSVDKNKLYELDLCITPVYHKKGDFYCLPEATLYAKSLTILKLDGLKMEGPFQLSLPSLKILSLKNIVALNDHSLEDLLANFPFLESLVLQTCKDLSSPRVSSSSLKSFEVQLLASHQTIKVEATNLRSLDVWSCCEISMAAACVSLKRVSLFYLEFDDRWFKDLIRGFSLESLTLLECCGWKNISVESRDLKNLVISIRTRPQEEGQVIRIDAPNLVSFTCKTWDVKLYHMSLNFSNLLVCDINIVGCRPYDSNWYVNLVGLLSKISGSKNICLRVDSEKALIFPKNLRSMFRSSLLTLEHVKVKSSRPLSKSSDIRDTFYWLSPALKSFSIEHGRHCY